MLSFRSLVLTFFCLYVVAADTVVNLGYASYRGTALSNGISQWLGMRFAAPPVGKLRFAAPQDPPVMKGIQDATKVQLHLLLLRSFFFFGTCLL